VHGDIRFICQTEKIYHIEGSDVDGRTISKWASSRVDQCMDGD
jgi:hypothetical protein